MNEHSVVYKITPATDWQKAVAANKFTGAPIDLADGFIHFSTAEQTAETAAKHFTGQEDLLLVAIACEPLGDALKWEVSRGDALFPHLYADLDMTAVLWAKPMPVGKDGLHILPKFEN